MELIELPDSNEKVGIFLEDIKRAGYKKPLRVALHLTAVKYKETKEQKYIDTFNRLMLVKRLLMCYNYYMKHKVKHRANLIKDILKSFGVL